MAQGESAGMDLRSQAVWHKGFDYLQIGIGIWECLQLHMSSKAKTDMV